MLSSKEIKSVHLEVTDKCNAACPMCARNVNGGALNPNLRLVEMTLAEAMTVFSPEFLRQLRFIQLCGNFGDPIAAKDTAEILEYFRGENPKLSLGIHTNGGIRTTEWWQRVGRVLSQSGDYCKFGLDGLEDTNHIYRRNTNWQKIIENVKSFIDAGGVAHWEFLVFRHNEHQVEEARSLAQAMGFKEFYVKKTSRFFDYRLGKNIEFPIMNRNGEVIDHLYPPQNEDFVNPVSRFQDQKNLNSTISNKVTEKMKNHIEQAVVESATLLKEHGSIRNYLNETGIDCMSVRDRSVYISARGEIYPCCFLGGQVRYSRPGEDGERISRLTNEIRGGVDGISGVHHSLPSIVDEGWFAEIKATWSEPSTSPKSIETCRRMCGKKLQLVSAEYA